MKDNKESEITGMDLLTDNPIDEPEQDRLNRKTFANNLAQSIFNYNEDSCFTVAIYGQWGSGKSSLLNLIHKYLNAIPKSSRYVILRFNPWNITSLDQLIILFFHELKTAIAGSNKADNWRKNVSNLLDVLSGVLTIGELSPIGSQYFSFGGKITKQVSRKINDQKVKPIDKIKQELDALISDNLDRIFVLIDDIDRLDKVAIKLMFRMIRLNADFKKMTYILAFDNNVVEEILKEEQPNYGKEYLGKIIQLAINIPDIDGEILKEILRVELDKFLNSHEDISFNKERWNELVVSGGFFELFRNIRDVVRYVNGLKVVYQNVHNEVNIVDFMALEAIRLLYSEYYEFIRNNKLLFTQLRTSSKPLAREDITGSREIFKKVFYLEGSPKGEEIEITRQGNQVWSICKLLFPHLGRIERDFSFASGFHQKWRSDKRICSDEMFDKYFIMGVPRGDITDEEMRSIVSLGDDHKNLVRTLENLSERRLLRRFFEKSDDYLGYFVKANTKEVITALFNIEEKLVSEPSVALSPPLYFYAASLIIKLLLLLANEQQRKQIILDLIRETSKLFSAVYFIHHITPTEERQSDKPERDLEELAFSIDDLKEFQVLCIDKIKQNADNDSLLSVPHLGLLLSKWRDWGNKADVDSFVQRFTDTDKGIIAILEGFSSERSGSRGRKILVNREWLEKFIDIKAFEAKVQNVDKSKLDMAQKDLVDSFIKGEDIFDIS